MKRLHWILLFAPLLACDAEAPGPGDGGDRGPIGKSDLVGSCEGHCGDASDGNCWCDDLCESFGDCCSDYASVCTDCVEGFEFVADEGACLADAACYALDDGGFCTGLCPEGLELDLDGEPACVPTGGACLPGFDLVPDASECLQDVACYETAEGFCTGLCPEGQQLDLDGEPACVPATAVCIEGFELVETESDCLQDAVCYPSADMFCTGECPEGTQFSFTEAGPDCIPA